mgnify:CR=1 FL=1
MTKDELKKKYPKVYQLARSSRERNGEAVTKDELKKKYPKVYQLVSRKRKFTVRDVAQAMNRSEEHTSELQSQR